MQVGIHVHTDQQNQSENAGTCKKTGRCREKLNVDISRAVLCRDGKRMQVAHIHKCK